MSSRFDTTHERAWQDRQTGGQRTTYDIAGAVHSIAQHKWHRIRPIADRNQPEWAIQSQLIRLWFSIISLLNGTLQVQVCVINTMRGMATLTSRSRPYARWSRHQLTICPESERQRRRIWLQNRFHNYSRYELISETDVLGATSTIHVTSIDVFSCPWPWAVLEKLDIGLNPIRYIPWLCKTALWATGQNAQLMSFL